MEGKCIVCDKKATTEFLVRNSRTKTVMANKYCTKHKPRISDDNLTLIDWEK